MFQNSYVKVVEIIQKNDVYLVSLITYQLLQKEW